ncbi:MAG: hydroxymethylbilane synthase [Ornithinimicrobium sp.]|uniref:hydroxymethylbilane synthase n=1 Tax=Ornithinimicrobium sp. TaxID=1977084 RepID=UPI003D9BF60E
MTWVRHTPPFTSAEQQCMTGRPEEPSAQGARVLRLGTRTSTLAATQAGWVADRLRGRGQDVELVPVRTEGDLSTAPLTQIGGTGVFVSALRTALLDGDIDVAVHSLKDLPVAPEPGLVVAAVPEREDPRDVVITRTGVSLAELDVGAPVGTGSPRRAAQLQLLAPQVRIVDIRGNVDTRIAKVRSGEVDAIVLAAAGLIRLNRMEDATEILDLDRMLPAPGQGALAVECRTDDIGVRQACATLDHRGTRAEITAERALLHRLEAGCTSPIGALARADAEGLSLTAFVALRGRSLRHTMAGSLPAELGQSVAEHLLDRLATAQPTPAESPTTTERDL